MCGRFAQLIKLNQLQMVLNIGRIRIIPPMDDPPPLFSIAPTDMAWLLEIDSQAGDGNYVLHQETWGIRQGKRYQINSRIETLMRIPSGNALKAAIVPATGFFEWKREGKQATPYFIYPANSEYFWFAAVKVVAANEEAFSIITTAAPDRFRWLHHRVPLMLKSSAVAEWRSFQRQRWSDFLGGCQHVPVDEVAWHRVSRRINSVHCENSPELIRPVREADESLPGF